ncbi:methyl-accepting chemotaxis protein [Epibacterium sp. Ofav1-8]|jgi:methyl-accepting chemotaxis protein|uniref:methyl-accepting chemotaxis protein n=1 Tax=Epibacterium sp. Ofav1-8 TaxID=2917735 RepID=UPI00272E42D8|nr:methyl-accepting chemotaxis protein [Epibacterium sp. Ofav1-8]
MTLTDIQSDAVMAIGPCRIAALSLVALLHQDTKVSGDPESERALTLSAKRIATAHQMLSEDLVARLQDSSYELPEHLEERRVACLDVLEPLHAVTTGGGASMMERIRALPQVEELCLHRLEPAISGFLDALVEQLSAAQRSRDAQRSGDMLDAIKNAEAVGRNIRLIAFNASIEAARIGDQGKGFAVIATEIRGLADHTQTLLTDIAGFLRT